MASGTHSNSINPDRKLINISPSPRYAFIILKWVRSAMPVIPQIQKLNWHFFRNSGDHKFGYLS